MTKEQFANAIAQDEDIIFDQMFSFRQTYFDMPDGAFYALALDMYGWDTDDWAWFTEEQESRSN